MIPLAVMTMVYDDDVFLDIWLRYWEQHVPRSNLYVLIHDKYDHYEKICAGCNTIRIARPQITENFERHRWHMLSRICSGLTTMFKKVIYTDVDEIIVLDPLTGENLVDHILATPDPVCSPFGVELVHYLQDEPEAYDPSRPTLGQRRHIAPHMLHSKASIISDQIRWSSGGHYCDKQHIGLSDHLVVFHLRLFDHDIYTSRAKARGEMTRDPETGENIKNLGGPSWRGRTGEHAQFAPPPPEPLENFAFDEQREIWLRPTKHGMVWKRYGKLVPKLYRIPPRFEGLF